MRKALKLIGKGFIFGLTHPFSKTYGNRWERDDVEVKEILFDGMGIGLGQGIVGAIYEPAIALGALCLLGYVSKKIENLPVRAEMVVDKK